MKIVKRWKKCFDVQVIWPYLLPYRLIELLTYYRAANIFLIDSKVYLGPRNKCTLFFMVFQTNKACIGVKVNKCLTKFALQAETHISICHSGPATLLYSLSKVWNSKNTQKCCKAHTQEKQYEGWSYNVCLSWTIFIL